MTLNNYQLILLDNIIYLDKFAKIKQDVNKGNEYKVSDLVTDLLDHKEIEMYWKDELKKEEPDKPIAGQCLMNLNE